MVKQDKVNALLSVLAIVRKFVVVFGETVFFKYHVIIFYLILKSNKKDLEKN
jgi:hypothetical protein